MLRKTILQIDNNLNETEKVEEICVNVARAMEEVKNYKINYILYVENLSLQDKKVALQDIKESLQEILDFINGAKDVIDH